ncbi:hypothetical protein QYE76_056671 [Lolium multiflorum]|uniref:RNase H type-1 domain-containing protein n=1 Tax=Lolium multiflorum TaxID=4521 RepID=A0AAD8WN28_LOLMU|nr:hypothetical protein QYE76_056671 [Lolium multiflorum]
MKPPTTKKELQRLIGKINFVRRFISNLSGRIEPFMGLVKIKSDEEFRWGAEQQRAFDEIKERMLDAETRYPEIEKLCLCLFFTCTKLHHILLTAEIVVICKSDVIKHMLSAPVLKGRLGKWMFALSEFDIRYQPAKAVKGQALADLIAERINTDIAALSVRAWAMFFDGSVCDGGCGIGILIVSPRGATYSFSIRLPTPCTNNVAEYEAICKGMELLLEAGAEAVELFGDSKLVISQLTEEYKCESESLFPLWMQCRELMAQFKYINFNWIPRSQNTEANDLAQMASGYKDVADGADIQMTKEARGGASWTQGGPRQQGGAAHGLAAPPCCVGAPQPLSPPFLRVLLRPENLSHRGYLTKSYSRLCGAENTREKRALRRAGIRRGNSLPEGEIDAIAIVIELDIISIIIIISTIYTAITTAAPRHRCNDLGWILIV